MGEVWAPEWTLSSTVTGKGSEFEWPHDVQCSNRIAIEVRKIKKGLKMIFCVGVSGGLRRGDKTSHSYCR